jgi:hypothetical protein
VTLAVSNLDEQISELKERGISAPPPMRNPQVSVVMIKDPDGNSIALAESFAPSMSQ